MFTKRIAQISVMLVVLVGILLPASFGNFDYVHADEESQLQAELDRLEQEINVLESSLQDQKRQTGSIQVDVQRLETQIRQRRLDIERKNTLLRKLRNDIDQKSSTIENLTSKEARQKEALAVLLRKKREFDDVTMAEFLLSGENLSDFFKTVDDIRAVNRSLDISFKSIRITRALTREEREELQEKQSEEAQNKLAIENAKQQVEAQEAEKRRLLEASKSQEKTYENIIEDREAQAEEIRNRLFELAGGSGETSFEYNVTFGEALIMARQAEAATGVRAALILSILTQESGLFRNVGGCYLTNTQTGAGIRIKTGASVAKVMKPTRDVAPFFEITGRLGLDPYKTPVSCPIANAPGWGSAMGPAQFIPSTWELFEAEIARNLGKSAANPWIPDDAVMAVGTYLDNLGADGGSWNAEREAACKYYSGVSCFHPTISNMWYGNQVMARAARIQNDIDALD